MISLDAQINSDNIIKVVPFPLDEAYKEFQDPQHPRKNPFFACYISKIEYQKRVSKEFTLLEGVELEPEQRPTADQVEPTSLRHVLVMVINSPKDDFTHVEEIWDGDLSKSNYVTGLGINLRRWANVLAAYVGGAQSGKLMSDEHCLSLNKDFKKDFENYFKTLAIVFNTSRNGKPVFKTNEDQKILCRVKLVRQGKGQRPNNIQLSSNGNCWERIVEGRKSILSVTGNDVFLSVAKPTRTARRNPSQAASPVSSTDEPVWPEVA